MAKTVLCLALTAITLLGSGCATNSIVGRDGVRVVQRGQYFGDVGITGDTIELTITSGSKVPKLSIVGDQNSVLVEEGVSLGEVEFWGNGNTVSLPEDLSVRVGQVGANQVYRRKKGEPLTTGEKSTTIESTTESTMESEDSADSGG